MSSPRFHLLAVPALLLVPVISQAHAEENVKPATVVMFGSCIKQAQPAPILNTIARHKPDLFVFLGDNIYGDTDDMQEMRAKYQQLAQKPGFQLLKKSTTLLATWDDHDYGKNDAGADYQHRDASKREFLTFWEEPKTSARWTRPGVYESYLRGPVGKRLQVILLDTRYFRSPLKRGPTRRVGGPWVRDDDDTTKTMLGEAQWEWLEEQLLKSAEVRVIASSIQFAATASGQECWENLPHERDRMIELIRKTRAHGVVFISGDRHWSELSQVTQNAKYPLLDLTSSSLNQVHPRGTPTYNEARMKPKTYHKPNYGVIEIDWDNAEPKVQLQIRGLSDEVQTEHGFTASQPAQAEGGKNSREGVVTSADVGRR
ncbi:MAG: alkaline phosphatase D family protein [Planctomycetaceae bacterium]